MLIVDDDARGRRSLSKLLHSLGHGVIEVSSTAEGITRLTEAPFDLILTELRTRRVDGLAVLRAARAAVVEPRVVMVVGRPALASAVEAMKQGAFDYVPKPIRRASLASVLERAEVGPAPRPEGKEPRRDRTTPALLDVRRTVPMMRPTPHALGLGRLESRDGGPTAPDGLVQKVLRIEATDAAPNLLGRLLVGSYITGQDQVLITARSGVTPAQREEIRTTADRILGMTIVGDSGTLIEVQNFVDPKKYELPRLLARVVRMLESELQLCASALSNREPSPLAKVEAIEEDIDRFYLLMVRQLLLSSDSPTIARSIDVESHHYQLGYRLVAKVLEVTGDLLHGVAKELDANLAGLRALPAPDFDRLVRIVRRAEALLTQTMDAFARLSVVDANGALNAIGSSLPADSSLGDSFARNIPDRKVALAAERMVCNLVMGMEMLVIVNEVTINRSVEPETVARTGTRVPLARPRAPGPGPARVGSPGPRRSSRTTRPA